MYLSKLVSEKKVADESQQNIYDLLSPLFYTLFYTSALILSFYFLSPHSLFPLIILSSQTPSILKSSFSHFVLSTNWVSLNAWAGQQTVLVG